MAEKTDKKEPKEKAGTRKTSKTSGTPKGKDAREKKVLKRDIPHNIIPITQETWLVQPLAVGMMRHDFTQTQNRVLVAIVKSLQKEIKRNQHSSGIVQLDMFKDRELDPEDTNKIAIKLYYKEILDDAKNYYALEKSLKMLSDVSVEIPASKDGKRKIWDKHTHLCDVFTSKEIRYNKFCIVKIDKEIAEQMISKKFGYSMLGKEIVDHASNRYTQRIYMILCGWIDRGSCVLNTLEFRKSLRLENKYPSFKDFVKRVLDPPQAELKESFEAGASNLWFEWKPLYKSADYKKTEYPENLQFTIHSMSGDQGREEFPEVQRANMEDMLMRHFSLTKENAEAIVARIPNHRLGMQKIMMIGEYIKRNQISTPARISEYAMKSFRNWFEELEARCGVVIEDADYEEVTGEDTGDVPNDSDQ